MKPTMTPEQKALALENLTEARAILQDKDAWTKGTLKRRRMVKPSASDPLISPPLYSYCALGAINKADGPARRVNAAKKVLAAAIKIMFPRRGGGSYASASLRIMGFNDSTRTKHEELLSVFDKAIEMAGSDAEIKNISL